MKKYFSIILSLFLLGFSACKTTDNTINPETGPNEEGGTGVVTEVGKPLGVPVSATIGPGGGKITTADGKLTLEIPAGALEKTENIKLQLTERTFPSGVGPAFSVEPKDLKLKKPVSFIWHHGEDGVNGSAPEATGIAYQTEDGDWKGKVDVEIDKVKYSIRARMPNFLHPMAFYEQYYMAPIAQELLPNQRVLLTVFFEPGHHESEHQTPDELFVPILGPRTALDKMDLKDWQLNGLTKISDQQKKVMGTLDLIGQGAQAMYIAPECVLPKNYSPTAVSVKLNLKQKGQIILVCQMTVEDPKNEVTVNGINIKNPNIRVVTEGGGLSFVIWEASQVPGKRTVSVSGLIDPSVFNGIGTYDIKGYQWGLSHVNVSASDYEDSYDDRWIPSPNNEAWGPGSITITQIGGPGKPIEGHVNSTLHTYIEKQKSWKHVSVSAKFKVISNYFAGAGG